MKFLIIFLIFCYFPAQSFAKSVKNVGEVPNVLKSNIHRDHFKEGMTGKRPFKTALPCEEIAKLFEYLEDKSEFECQTHPWSYQGKKVILLALRNEIYNEKTTLDLGIINDQEKSKILIRLEKPIDLLQSFEHVDKFDSTIFDLGVLGKAFGLRISKTGCGAGGSVCADGFLHLFIIDNDKIVPIFSSQMSYYGSFGGEWNKDGTRQHDVVEEIAILQIKKDPKHPESPPTLIKKLKGKKSGIQTFIWNAELKDYTTKDSSFLPSVDGEIKKETPTTH